MAKSIVDLHSYLKEHFTLASLALYFQPPENIKLEYPCIIYSFNGVVSTHADNIVYRVENKFSLMLITKQIEELLFKKLLELPSARYERLFVKEGLYHYVVTIHTIPD